MPDEYSIYFRSVIVKGTIHAVLARDGMIKGCCYSARNIPPVLSRRINNHMPVQRLDIDSMTGKETIELVRKRKESIR